MTGTQEQRHPPQLGDVEMRNAGADGWQLWIKGTQACGGLTPRQVLAVIRGELDIASLVQGNGKATVATIDNGIGKATGEA